jgi:hypothetical protein
MVVDGALLTEELIQPMLGDRTLACGIGVDAVTVTRLFSM